MNDKTDLAEQIRTLRVEYVRIRDTYRKAIEKAGFKVEMNQGNNDRCVMVISSTKVDARFFEQNFALSIETRYSKASLVGTYREKNTGYGGRPRRYTKFGTEQLVKLMELIKDGETQGISSAKAYSDHQADQNMRENTMVKELGGTVVPPCADIKPILGNGPQAGKYVLDISRRYGSGCLSNMAMTAEQVKKLVAVLNEIQGTDKLFVLQATSKENPAHVRHWGHHDWSLSQYGDIRLFTRDEADAILVQAKAALKLVDEFDIEILPYAAYAVIA